MPDGLKDKMDNAQEAEADPDRHHMEEAILATLATAAFDQDEVALSARTVNWSRSDFGAIAAALVESVTEGKVPDKVVITDKLRSARIQDAVLTDIMEGKGAKDVSVILDYIGIIHAQDKRRAAEAFGRDYLKAVKEGDIDAAFAVLAGKVFDLATDRKLIRAYPVEQDAAAGFLDILNARRSDGRDYLGLDCGFDHLNNVLNGLTDGVIILGGMPSCGKTTLAKQIADHVAEVEKVPVLFYSFEQSAEELRIKSLSRLSSVDSRRIWKGRSVAAEWSEVEKAAEDYLVGPGPYLTIIEAGRKDTVEAIRAAALMAKRKAGDKRVLLILDYLQIIPAGKDAPDALRERIDANLSELRRLSRDLKSPVLVVSTLNRGAYGDPTKPPTLIALKESGGIEYSADGVIILWRNEAESDRLTKDESNSLKLRIDRIEAHVLKNRNGEVGARVKLDFTPAWGKFDAAVGN
jgi:replicative DNA helicase